MSRIAGERTFELWGVPEHIVVGLANDRMVSTVMFLETGLEFMMAINTKTIRKQSLLTLMGNHEEWALYQKRQKTIDFYLERLKDLSDGS